MFWAEVNLPFTEIMLSFCRSPWSKMIPSDGHSTVGIVGTDSDVNPFVLDRDFDGIGLYFSISMGLLKNSSKVE